MRSTWTAAALILFWAAAGPAVAQETEFRAVSNPFQEGFPYTVGEEMAPNVNIDGVRWTLVQVVTKGDREIVEDREIPVVVDLEFENRRERAVNLLVILLLENEDGDPLERIRCNPIRAGAGRFKTATQKAKVMGNALLNTRRLYLFCELQD
jgi:hypothetical protein